MPLDVDDGVDDGDWELSPENAHPKAVKSLKEEFFWDICDDAAPFGTDTGCDTLMFYRDWHQENPTPNPNTFLAELLQGWKVVNDCWDLLSKVEIMNEFEKDHYSLITRDRVIIALAFAQIVLDGKCDKTIKQKALWAIERQQSEVLLKEIFDEDFHEESKNRLMLMGKVLRDFDNE